MSPGHVSWSDAIGHGETTCSPGQVYRSRLDSISLDQKHFGHGETTFLPVRSIWSRLDNISPGQKHLVTVRQHVSWSDAIGHG
jgi:hypothetical protein